jgi:hypothetical protein
MTPDKSKRLDELLNLFGDSIYLKQKEILSLFAGDENLAAEYMNILCSLQLVNEGAKAGSKLALMYIKQIGADMFISEGGFIGQYNRKLAESTQQQDRQKLEVENLTLQNEALTYQATIRDQEAVIRLLDEKNKRFELLKNYEWLIRLAIAVFVGLAGYFFW